MRGAHNPRDAPPDRLASTSVFLSNDSSQKTDVPEIVGERFKKRQKILVCAPSNAALDEIVLRIMHSGLLGPDGKVYSPTLVRVGVNAHHSVEKVSMEYLVNERCGGGEEDKFSDGKGNGYVLGLSPNPGLPVRPYKTDTFLSQSQQLFQQVRKGPGAGPREVFAAGRGAGCLFHVKLLRQRDVLPDDETVRRRRD